jgi:hypothetical protein
MKLGEYKTKNGKNARIIEFWPKMREYFGYVYWSGATYETLWDSTGKNLEEPEWDLVMEERYDIGR